MSAELKRADDSSVGVQVRSLAGEAHDLLNGGGGQAFQARELLRRIDKARKHAEGRAGAAIVKWLDNLRARVVAYLSDQTDPTERL